MTVQAVFAPLMVAWQRAHGRQHLPWQHTQDPYRVWLSETMLQQTQVVTVLGYYARFLERFPTVQHLADAPLEEVLALWSGLGYYSRARHLHRCAQAVVAHWGGVFPATAAALQTLPGIGPSTAAAVAAFCHGERVSIMDGNVRRVLSRVLGDGADQSVAAHQKALAARAAQLLPQAGQDMPAYTQALMDLGAGLCQPRKTQCSACPVQHLCAAHAQGRQLDYPVKTRRIKRSSCALWLLWAVNAQGQVWLQQRPETGIWAKMHCLPAFEAADDLRMACPAHAVFHDDAPFKHVLTHRDLHLHPVRWMVPAGQTPACEGSWFAPDAWQAVGLPAPIRALLNP